MEFEFLRSDETCYCIAYYLTRLQAPKLDKLGIPFLWSTRPYLDQFISQLKYDSLSIFKECINEYEFFVQVRLPSKNVDQKTREEIVISGINFANKKQFVAMIYQEDKIIMYKCSNGIIHIHAMFHSIKDIRMRRKEYCFWDIKDGPKDIEEKVFYALYEVGIDESEDAFTTDGLRLLKEIVNTFCNT